MEQWKENLRKWAIENRVEDRFKDLENLTLLDLSKQELLELPPEIGNLINLQELNLIDNKLKTIPSEIGNLHNLKILNLYYNKLKDLPLEICYLENLQELDLSGSFLSKRFISRTGHIYSSFPPIENLKNLRELSLEESGLEDFPSEISKLTNLEILFLNWNFLKKLPPEIGKLLKLEKLTLGGNQLKKLPPEIGNLKNLKFLSLEDNPLKELPLEVEYLSNLEMLTNTKDELIQRNKYESVIEFFLRAGFKIEKKKRQIMKEANTEQSEENLVKKTCRELGITQKELAQITGFKEQTIRNWSSSKEFPEYSKAFFAILLENKKYKDALFHFNQFSNIINSVKSNIL
jgi:DNA-binding XRE family transcriptional regulator